ncbi:mycothione reductase [Brooklawnia cerclae]|uniref:Mycothione reductase n=1 Tax=Brooklawnia cerclae TaxID=349934 RepID=A0ABX0SG45_9ACTN|nr:mycothione reductase [Brooklawnia cerclae]
MGTSAREGNRVGHVDLAIIGSGSGLSLIDDDIDGWRIALIDNGVGPTDAFGGTCLNAGCIPTKMLAMPARYAVAPAQARAVDVNLSFRGADFAALQARVFGRTDAIAASGLAGLVARPNVSVLHGAATFIDAHTLHVAGQTFTADRIVLAAGSRPRLLDAPGFDEPYLGAFVHTSESIMRVPQLPKRLIIIGGGTEAVEFGHIFSGLGSQVAIIARRDSLLRAFDPDVAAAVTAALGERVVLRLNQQATGLEPDDDGGVVLTTQDPDGIEYSYAADAVLVCAGRIPNGDQLHLERAGVEVDDEGFVRTDEHLRTTAAHIWALGDICNRHMLKHLANAQARVVKRNLLAERDGGALVASDERFVPQGVFGLPEVATVGATAAELERAGTPFVAYTHKYGWTAYGWAIADENHFVKLLGDPESGRLLGAHIVGPEATSLIQPLIQGMSFGQDASTIARGQYWIHPAPTEVVENALLGLDRAIAEHRRAGEAPGTAI